MGDQSSSGVVEYYCGSLVPTSTKHNARARTVHGLTQVLKSAFLPEGFPQSVTNDYVGFQVWDTVQALSSYVRGMLSSQAILKGVGVGQQAATPLGAVFQFFVRDLLGMLGGILFTYIEGSNFDSCAKQWRLFADVTNDLGMAVELASPFFPSMFLAMACFGSLARSLTGVAGGATRAALTMHFAKQGNAADIAAKEQSQETATTMIGMMLGMLVTRVTADHLLLSWGIFVVLTLVHVYANVRAMRCLVLTSLNKPRLEHIVATYMKQGLMTNPMLLSREEDLMPGPYRALLQLLGGGRDKAARIVFGARPSAMVASRPDLWGSSAPQLPVLAPPDKPAAEPLKFGDAWKQPEPCPYVLGCVNGAIMVVLRKGASVRGVLQAFVHAAVLRHFLEQQPKRGQLAGEHKVAEQQAQQWMTDKFVAFSEQLRVCGWNLQRVSLPRPLWTADWAPAAKKQT